MAGKLSPKEMSSLLEERRPDLELLEYNGTRHPVKLKCRRCGALISYSRADNLFDIKCRKCQEDGHIGQQKIGIEETLVSRGLSHIEILEFEGFGNPAVMHCRKCDWVGSISDSRRLETTPGCPNCDSRRQRLPWNAEALNELLENQGSSLRIVKCHDDGKTADVHCRACNSDMAIVNIRKKIHADKLSCPNCRQRQRDLDALEEKARKSPDDISIESYASDTRTAVIMCRSCGCSWTVKANSPEGYRCPQCKEKRKAGITSRLSQEKYRKRLDSWGFDYIEIVEYTKMTAPVTLKCSHCGNTFTFSEAKRRFRECPYCNPRSTYHKGLIDARRRLDTRGLNYVEIVSYESSSKPADFKCCLCGCKWHQEEARQMLDRTSSCPFCHGTGQVGLSMPRKLKVDQDEAQRRLDDVDAKLELLEYSSQAEPVTVRCRRCGRTWQEKHIREIMRGAKIPCADCGQVDRDEQRRLEWQKFVNEHFKGELKVVSAVAGEKRNKIHIVCGKCGTDIVKRTTTLQNENVWNIELCPTCNPRTIKGMPMSEAAYRKFFEDKTDGTIRCLEFHGNNDFAKFKCIECGHEWQAIANQLTTRQTGCPMCRQKMSLPEKAIYYYLHKLLGDDVFCNPYIHFLDGRKYQLDVFIPGKRLILEYDGFKWHADKKTRKHDMEREQAFADVGLDVIHFKEVRAGKGRYRFYARTPYWIPSGDINANKKRNDAISSALKHLITEELGMPLPFEVDVDAEQNAIRAFWKATMGSSGIEFDVAVAADGTTVVSPR